MLFIFLAFCYPFVFQRNNTKLRSTNIHSKKSESKPLKLTNKIKELEEKKAALEEKLNTVETEHGDYLMDNDLRITMLELGLA